MVSFAYGSRLPEYIKERTAEGKNSSRLLLTYSFYGNGYADYGNRYDTHPSRIQK